MSESDRCEECGQNLHLGCRKRIGWKGWCSDTCLKRAGIIPRPEPKVFKRENTVPRVPGDKSKSHKADRSEGLYGAI